MDIDKLEELLSDMELNRDFSVADLKKMYHFIQVYAKNFGSPTVKEASKMPTVISPNRRWIYSGTFGKMKIKEDTYFLNKGDGFLLYYSALVKSTNKRSLYEGNNYTWLWHAVNNSDAIEIDIHKWLTMCPRSYKDRTGKKGMLINTETMEPIGPSETKPDDKHPLLPIKHYWGALQFLSAFGEARAHHTLNDEVNSVTIGNKWFGINIYSK